MSAAFQMMVTPESTEVAAVLAAFGRFATPARMPESMRREWLVVLDEVLANVAMHGIASAATGHASVVVNLRGDDVEVVVTDNGPAFDPLTHATPDTALSVDERPIGGLGLYLVRRLVDEVRYTRDAQHNILTLTKRLPAGWVPDETGAS